MKAADREAALKALAELKSVHQGLGAIGVRWRRCKNPQSKVSRRYEKAHDELSRKGLELSETISNLIRLGVS